MKDGTPQRLARRTFLKGALASAPVLAVGSSLLRPGPAFASDIGPSTKTEPYLIPSVPGVQLVSILTVGDAVGGYRMVGIPDGLGVYASGPHQFTLMMNHELTATSGIARGTAPRARSSRGGRSTGGPSRSSRARTSPGTRRTCSSGT